MNYQEIRKAKENATNKLFEECKVFWAFSKEQFEENKTPLKEGEKYVDIGAGGFMPRGNYDTLIKGMKTIDKDFKEKMKDVKIREEHILYELNNHEAFYTMDTQSTKDALGDDYTIEEIIEVYNKFKKKNINKTLLLKK